MGSKSISQFSHTNTPLDTKNNHSGHVRAYKSHLEKARPKQQPDCLKYFGLSDQAITALNRSQDVKSTKQKQIEQALAQAAAMEAISLAIRGRSKPIKSVQWGWRNRLAWLINKLIGD